ncbi:hypothetical protein K435DRAFT_782645 [Dendrothele bispora CBS 962.96]|uniref:Uncharacterized protein n=1 Tax=Dendrothele bispora (strain CBS 962.96) TaxID=1314807 RepID=A0A4S8LE44_DENBC|nr:hypothetical protein K435DRAFT_782645 [Dendrothele bispora CBS 962.96]
MPFTLVPNVIYTVLTGTGKIGQFHWMLVVASSASDGYLFHATNNSGTRPWHYQCTPWDLSYPSSSSCSSCESDYSELEHSSSLIENAVSFTPIGNLSTFGDGLDATHLNEYLKDIPIPRTTSVESLFDERFSILWWRQALRTLHQSEMFVRCMNVDAFEGELKRKSTAAEYAKFMHPLPRVFSTKWAGPWPES